eukprot:400729-Rhodomonas_salina.4
MQDGESAFVGSGDDGFGGGGAGVRVMRDREGGTADVQDAHSASQKADGSRVRMLSCHAWSRRWLLLCNLEAFIRLVSCRR